MGQAAWNRVNRVGSLEQSDQGRRPGTEGTGQVAWNRVKRSDSLE